MTPIVDRVRTTNPLTRAQLAAISLVADGWSYHEAARLAGVTYGTFCAHIALAASRIPGDLPQLAKVITWYRGASAAVLGVDTTVPMRQTSLKRAYTIYGGHHCPHCGNVALHATTRPDAAPAGHE